MKINYAKPSGGSGLRCTTGTGSELLATASVRSVPAWQVRLVVRLYESAGIRGSTIGKHSTGGNAVWQGRFSGGDQDELLFYNEGDSHWWVGAVTSPAHESLGCSRAGVSLGPVIT